MAEAKGPLLQDQEKSIDKISKSLDETDLILQREAEQAGKEMAKEVDKELEAVEGIVEEVTHLKDTDTVDNSEIVLGMLSESQVKEINGHEKAEQQAAKVEGAEGQPVDSAVATATQWHQPNHKVTVGELQHKASYAADEISGALQSRLVRNRTP